MSEEIRVPTAFYRPMPQPHEPWTPTYTDTLSYKMAKGERVPLWFRVRSSGPVTLSLGGADSASFSAEFFKPYGQQVNNVDAYRRASLAATPQGVYYDPLNPIPSGSNNFVPEVPDGYEIVYLLLSCSSSATSGNKSLTVSLGSESISIAIHVWNNVSLPASPSKPVLMNVTSGSANRGVNGRYISDAKTVQATNAVTDLLVKHRVTPYMNGLAFLPISAGKLDIDYLSGSNSSYRQMFLNRVPSGAPKLWMAMPQIQASHRTLAYAQAAEATIAAEGLSSMYVYIWDEPNTQTATATAIKGILDNWKNGSPSTTPILTANKDWFSNPNVAASGILLSDYPGLILLPVINQVGGSFTGISGYSNGKFGFYTSCQGNCGPDQNSNSTTGSDTGVVDLAYIDMPMIRRYAAMLLAMRTTWVDKTAMLLHYDSTQSWTSFSGTTTASNQNPWLSARRFNIMGDGTFVYPAIPGWQPHVGVPAFTASSTAAVPSIRLLYLAHASFMADLFQLYLTAQSSNQAANLVTSPSSFSTDYQAYESLRDKIGTALENSTTIALGDNPIETVIPPEDEDDTDPEPVPPPIEPPADPENPVDPEPTPDPVVPPPLPPPPVIPLPPSQPNTPVAGEDSGPTETDDTDAVPALIEGLSGLVAVLSTDTDECYAVLSNTLKKFSPYSEQFSLGVEPNSYVQIPVEDRLSNKVLKLDGQLTRLPAESSTLVDFFQDGTSEANYSNADKTRVLGPGASISDKLLDLRGTTATATRGANYGTGYNATGLCPLVQSGTIRMLFIPNYSGTPGIASSWDNLLFFARNGSAAPDITLAENALVLVHRDSGELEFSVANYDGSEKITASAEWSPLDGQEYIIDATYDLDRGLVEIWVDGFFLARKLGATDLSRTNEIEYMGVGSDLNAAFYASNHQVGGLTLFTTYREWSKWVMMGVPVGERFHLNSYSLSYAPLSDEQNPYRGAGSPDGGMNL